MIRVTATSVWRMRRKVKKPDMGFFREWVCGDLVDRRRRFNAARPRGGSTGRGGVDDRDEGGGGEAGAADQGAVDVGDGEQLGGIVGLDRAAVEDADAVAALAVAARRDAARIAACISATSAGVATLPVPIAQIGS